MITIQTRTNQTKNGVTVTARARGKQRTQPWNPAKSIQENHAAAAGVVTNLVTTREQQAKIFHPSGGQRFVIVTRNDGTGTITLDV